MTFTGLTDIQRKGRWALNRHYQGDGRWGSNRGSTGSAQGLHMFGWMVTKHRPTGTTWAKGRGHKARKVHAVRYSLQATRKGEEDQWLTVWLCGGQCWTKPVLVPKPFEVCRGCLNKVEQQPTVVPLPSRQPQDPDVA